MKAFIVALLILGGALSLSAQTPAELRKKAIDQLKSAIEQLESGKDNGALASVEGATLTSKKLLATETPADRGLIPPEEKAPETGVARIFDNLKKNGFSLQREPGPSDEAKPAEFTFTRTYLDGGDTAYGADFFLGWRPPGQQHNSLFEMSTQGKLHTGDEAKDAWIFRMSEIVNFRASTPESWHATISLKEESNMDFDVNRLSGELMFTPTWKKAAIGQYHPFAAFDETGNEPEDPSLLPSVQFRWRPYFGGDFGTWLGDVPTNERETSGRGYARVTLDFRLNFLRAALDLDDATLSFDETACITDGAGNHSYFKAALDLMFNDNVGFALSYKVGEDAPNFKDEHELTGSLTVKF